MYNTYMVGTKDYFQEEIRQSETKKRILYNALENLFSKGDPDDALKDEIVKGINDENINIYYAKRHLNELEGEK